MTPDEFTKIAKERYNIDFRTIQEAIEEYEKEMLKENKNLINEHQGIKNAISLMERIENVYEN